VSPAEAPAPPAAAALRAEHVTKEFGGLVAVADVSFDVPQYSIVSLIGPNGAGKTTLFNMLTGLYRPTRGRIVLGDRDITRSRPDLITGYGVARTFQNIKLFNTMTAIENVQVGMHCRMKGRVTGALLRTPFQPALGSRIEVLNGISQETQEFRVIRVSPCKFDGCFELGVEILYPTRNFWGIQFPDERLTA